MEDAPSQGKLGVIGIRREDKSKWERRVVLTPNEIAFLLKNHPHLKFIVQPSDKRIFRDNEYARAGAEISEDLSECSVIFGVKEPTIESLIPNRTYAIFSHVIKAQPYNMGLLDEILKRKIRLIDYEKITDSEGKRLVAFGHFAGNAGALDILFGLGKYFLNLGYSTPFLNMSFSYSYKNLAKAKEILEDVAESIKDGGIPQDCGPLIFAIAGAGRTAQGVMEILQCLPYKIVSPEEISDIVKDKQNPSHRSLIYITIIELQHMVARCDTAKPFSKQEYYSNPELYKPIFHEKYLQHISVLFNCIYWEQKYKRLISCQQIKELADSKNLRLISIADITCDLEGSIEMLKFFTNLDEPFFLYNPSTGEYSKDLTVPSRDILYLAIENLPTELAYDATSHFSEKLHPFVENIAMSDINLPLQEQTLVPSIKKAVIAWNGQLTPDFEYITQLRKENDKRRKKQFLQFIDPTSKHISLKMMGHLFDSKAINQILDHLEETKINFKVLDVQIGQNNDEKSSAHLQIMTKDKAGIQKVIETVSAIIDKYDITIED